MPFPKIVEKLIPAARWRHAAFSPQEAPSGATAPPSAPCAMPGQAPTPDGADAPPKPRRLSLFELVLQAYASAPGGD